MLNPQRIDTGPWLRLRMWLHGAVFARAGLWRNLRRDARHPVARHMRRHLKPQRRLRVVPLSLACLILLFFASANLHLAIDDAILWTLPLWLMAFSLVYCAIWIARIVSLISQCQADGILDEVSVIPPGPVFIYLTICKVVLNGADAAAWLTTLRRALAAIVFLVVMVSLFIVLMQLDAIEPAPVAAFVIESALIGSVILLEHEQSSVLACLLAIILSSRLRDQIDKASASVVCFGLLQILTYALPLALLIALNALSLSAALLVYLLAREWLIAGLWRQLLRQANAESTPSIVEIWRDASPKHANP